MNAFSGTVLDGQVILDEPACLPEGTRVEVVPVGQTTTTGMREEDWPTTQEGIAALLARMDSREPLEMSAEEEARWQATRQAQKEFEKAQFAEHAARLRRVWG